MNQAAAQDLPPASLIFVRGRSSLLLCRTPVQFKPVRFCSAAPADASHAVTSARDHHRTAHGYHCLYLFLETTRKECSSCLQAARSRLITFQNQSLVFTRFPKAFWASLQAGPLASSCGPAGSSACPQKHFLVK